MKCKFCGCTDDRPCHLPIDIEGNFLAIANPKTTVEFVPCAWLIPEVCSAPACVEHAYFLDRTIDQMLSEENLRAIGAVRIA